MPVFRDGKMYPVPQEMVPCTICSKPTPMLGTKLCDRCWEFDHHFDSLMRSNPEAAAAWLRVKVGELSEHICGSRDCRVCGGDGWTDGSKELRRDGKDSTICIACDGTGLEGSSEV